MTGMGNATSTAHAATQSEVRDYVLAVRGELADLAAEDVEELTGGMEADLTELVADAGGPLTARLGSPAAYAAELRAASGLPPRAQATGRPALSRRVIDIRTQLNTLRKRRPWAASAWDFMASLRPAWWVVRAVLATWVVTRFFGIGMRSLTGLLLLVVATAISVALGRGWGRDQALVRILTVAGNVLAALLLVPFLATAGTPSYNPGAYNPGALCPARGQPRRPAREQHLPVRRAGSPADRRPAV